MSSERIRLAALGLWHEANTFSTRTVDAAASDAVLRGDEIVLRHAQSTSTMSGYLAVDARPDVDVVPLMMTALVPAGPLTADALEIRADEMVRALADEWPFDGVLAALHGAAVSEDTPDVDGYLLARFREIVGPDVPIGASLDLHANISAEMCAYSDVLNTCRTNPHLDTKEAALEVAELIIRAARGEIHLTQAFEPVPAVINILCQNTAAPPMSEIMADVRAAMSEPGVLSASVAEGYPYADVPDMGMAVVVATDGDPQAAANHARALAERVWARRHRFHASAMSAEEAIRCAALARRGPVLLLDVGDNIGAGSPGDSVVLLNEARRLGFGGLLTIIADESAVAVCDRSGVGAHVSLSIGGRTDPETGPPVAATATVLALHDGAYEATEPVHAGMSSFNAGRTAAVRLDTGQTVILTSRVVLPLTTAQLILLGLEPSGFKAIVAKGVNSPLPGYDPHVADVIFVDTPGVSSADLTRFNYMRRRRPLFPFEVDTTYPAEP